MARVFLNKKVKGTKCWRKVSVVKNDRGRTIYQNFKNGDSEVSVTTLMPKLHALGIREGNREVGGIAYKEEKNALKDATKYMKQMDSC